MKTSGEAPGRAAAIDYETKPSSPVRDVLHILHGARSLAPAEAILALQPFLNTMHDQTAGSGRLADASTAGHRERARAKAGSRRRGDR